MEKQFCVWCIKAIPPGEEKWLNEIYVIHERCDDENIIRKIDEMREANRKFL